MLICGLSGYGSAGRGSQGIAYHYQDGTEDVLTCYHEDSRQVYVELNQGERGFLLQASQLETMLDTVKRLAAGEEIAARY